MAEKVTIDGEDTFVIEPDSDREPCLSYLRDCGHEVAVEPATGVPGERTTWAELSDLIEPRDS